MLKVFGPDNYFDYYLNDPTTPCLVSKVPLPQMSDRLEIIGFKEGPLVQQDKVHIQAASVLFSILFTLSWAEKIRPIPINKLKVCPRAGKQFNAYYNRTGLDFYYDIHPATKKIVFTSDSTEAVNHEFGHAILDSIRPDLLNSGVFEILCFHEAFGDIISMSSSLHHPMVIEYVLQETGGDLTKSNIISRMVEELGNAIYHKEPNSGRPENCLRDAVQTFRYVNPDILPSTGSFSGLCREIHNFSRVFSSIWYKIFVDIRNKYLKEGEYESIIKARDIMERLSLISLPLIEINNEIYQTTARAMLEVDKDIYGKEHFNILRGSFTCGNILPIPY